MNNKGSFSFMWEENINESNSDYKELNKRLKLIDTKIKLSLQNITLQELELLKEYLDYGFNVCGYRYPIVFQRRECRTGLIDIKNITPNNKDYEETVLKPFSALTSKTDYHIIWFTTRERYLEFLYMLSLLRYTEDTADRIKEIIKFYSCNFSEYFMTCRNLEPYMFGSEEKPYDNNEDYARFKGVVETIAEVKKEIDKLEAEINETIKGSEETNRD